MTKKIDLATSSVRNSEKLIENAAGEMVPRPVLVPQKKSGALLSGGVPGHKGGGGRPPSAIREHCRGSFAERVAILEMIADGEPLPMTKRVGDDITQIEVSAAIRERTQAIDLLGKYGGVDKLAIALDEQPEEALTPERVRRLFERMQRIRTVQQLEKILVGAAAQQAD